jgi:hypothetical protein
MPPIDARTEAAELLADPRCGCRSLGRSGPLVVEIDIASIRKTPRLPQCDAGSAAQPPAQRRLWLVDRADIADPELWTSAIIARPGSIICASAIARHNRSARCISAPWIFISGPTRCASTVLERPFPDRCAGRKIRRTAPPARCVPVATAGSGT